MRLKNSILNEWCNHEKKNVNKMNHLNEWYQTTAVNILKEQQLITHF